MSFPGSWLPRAPVHDLSPVRTARLRSRVITRRLTWFLVPIGYSCLAHVTLAVSRVFLLRIDRRAIVFIVLCFTGTAVLCKLPSWDEQSDDGGEEPKVNR